MLSKDTKSLVRRLVEKELDKKGKELQIGKCAFEKNKSNDFRTGGVQAQNGAASAVPLGRTLRPVGSGIGKGMGYRSVDENFWVSPRVWPLSRDAKLVYLYLISMGGLTGIVRVLPETIGTILDPEITHNADLQEYFEPDWAAKAIESLEHFGRIVCQPDEALIWVKGQVEHQILEKGELDPNKAKFLKKEIEKLPQGIIKQGIIEQYGSDIEGALDRAEIPYSPFVAPAKPLASGLQAPPHPLRESKVKESKEKVNKDKTFLSEPKAFSDEVANLVNLLISRMLINDQKAKVPPLDQNGHRDPRWIKWAEDADLLFRVDLRDPKEAEKLIHWCQNDSFWKTNILSMGKFRKQYPQLRLKWKKEQDWKPEETESDRRKRILDELPEGK